MSNIQKKQMLVVFQARFYQILIECFLAWSCMATASKCWEELRMNPFPQFQIVSAAKTGSTSLYSYLCEHAEIRCTAKKKELNLLRTRLAMRSEQVIVGLS